MCRSGSAADTEAVSGFVRDLVERHEMEIDSSADVKTVATIANQISYQNKGANRGRGLSAYTIVSGWDAAGRCARCMRGNGGETWSRSAGRRMGAVLRTFGDF